MLKKKMHNAWLQAKRWLKSENSQQNSETGMLIALAVFAVLVVGALFVPKLLSGLGHLLDRFNDATKQGDTTNWKQ